MISAPKILLGIALAICLAGCKREEIKVYSTPKETASAPPMSMAQRDVPTASSAAHLHWKTPTGWEELAPTSLRVGNFLIKSGDKKAEVSILPFPGTVGTELENINRWRGEIKLPAIAEAEVASENVSVGNDDAKLYDMTGAEQRTIAAILEKDGVSWFFKMRGDKDLVAQNKSAFGQFLKTIQFDTDDPPAEPPIATKPESTNTKQPSSLAAAASSNEPVWEVPATWKEIPPSAMVLKSFSAGDAEHEARISITAFPGDVGGALANVNRWRRQLSLDPAAQDDLEKLTTSIDVLGGKATLVDMKGTDAKSSQPARMMAAFVSRKDKTWFYKMMGDDSTISREKDAFLKFVQTVRYPNE